MVFKRDFVFKDDSFCCVFFPFTIRLIPLGNLLDCTHGLLHHMCLEHIK